MYNFEDIERRIISGEFRTLGQEAVAFFDEATALLMLDPDFPAVLSMMAVSPGPFPELGKVEVVAFITLILALQARQRGEAPSSASTPVPDVWRNGLAGLDLENL